MEADFLPRHLHIMKKINLLLLIFGSVFTLVKCNKQPLTFIEGGSFGDTYTIDTQTITINCYLPNQEYVSLDSIKYFPLVIQVGKEPEFLAKMEKNNLLIEGLGSFKPSNQFGKVAVIYTNTDKSMLLVDVKWDKEILNEDFKSFNRKKMINFLKKLQLSKSEKGQI